MGGIGIIYFILIVNVLEVVILGVFKFEMVFVWNGKEFVLCLMFLLLLLFDYCVIDGVDGVCFLSYINGVLVDICCLVM